MSNTEQIGTPTLMMKRLPNYKIHTAISTFTNFTNYNETIVGENVKSVSLYTIRHWETLLFTYNTATQKIEYIAPNHISTTSSILVGRIVRAIPKAIVLDYLANAPITRPQKRRIAKMLWL